MLIKCWNLDLLYWLRWDRIDNPKGFKLEFFFDPNPYLKNSVLTKTYHMIDEDEPILERATGNFQKGGMIGENLYSFVGTGYSFVEDTGLFVTSDEEAAIDLTTLLKKLYNKHKSLQKSPLYIVAESYGGKFAATVGLSVVGAVKAGELKLKLGGVVLGDSWISPEDFVLSWGPLLLDVSRLDKNGAENSNSLAEKIRDELKKGLYCDAERTWAKLEDFIISNTNNVDFCNFLQDDDSSGSKTTVGSYKESFKRRYSRYLSIKASSSSSCYIFTLN